VGDVAQQQQQQQLLHNEKMQTVTVKTDCAWPAVAGRAEAAADTVASPPPRMSTSICANVLLGGAATLGTAPLAQQSLTAGSGSKCNEYFQKKLQFIHLVSSDRAKTAKKSLKSSLPTVTSPGRSKTAKIIKG